MDAKSKLQRHVCMFCLVLLQTRLSQEHSCVGHLRRGGPGTPRNTVCLSVCVCVFVFVYVFVCVCVLSFFHLGESGGDLPQASAPNFSSEAVCRRPLKQCGFDPKLHGGNRVSKQTGSHTIWTSSWTSAAPLRALLRSLDFSQTARGLRKGFVFQGGSAPSSPSFRTFSRTSKKPPETF